MSSSIAPIEPAVAAPTGAQRMNIVIVGHVDHGKSTVIGRLLADTHSLPDGNPPREREGRYRCGHGQEQQQESSGDDQR